MLEFKKVADVLVVENTDKGEVFTAPPSLSYINHIWLKKLPFTSK